MTIEGTFPLEVSEFLSSLREAMQNRLSEDVHFSVSDYIKLAQFERELNKDIEQERADRTPRELTVTWVDNFTLISE